MATFSVGFFKATVLVGGTVLIGVLSFAAGAVLLQTPPADGDAVAGDSVAKAPASAESELLDTVIPDPLRSEMRGNVKVFGTRLGDAAGDQFVSGANAISDPVAKALESGSQALLPSFIADKVPWVTGHVRGSVINTGKSQVGGIFENAYGDALAGDIDLPGTDLLDGRAASAAVQTSEDEAIQRAAFMGEAPGRDDGVAAVDEDVNAYVGAGAASLGQARWTIQMARFATLRNAETFAAEMAARGIAASINIEKSGGRWWHLVQAGSYVSKGAAEAALGDLRRRGFGGAVVTEATGGYRG